MAPRGVSGVAVGVDVGGTKTVAGLVGADGSVLDRVRHDTPERDEDIAALIAATAQGLERAHGLDGVPVGVGAAGLIDADGTVRYAPNIAWADFPLRRILGETLARPVTVDNDANAAAWGEFVAGAGKDATASMVMITVGTGVGGGLVLDGRLVRGANGMAGELGHIAVAEGGPRCPCGASGCLEAVASGTAIARRAREALADGRIGPDSALAAIPPEQVRGKDVTVAAHAGDPEAAGILHEAGRWLGVGIASAVAAFDPEVVVLGGGAMEAGSLLMDPAREALAARLLGRGHRQAPPVVPAAMADDAGLVGAALLALGSPTGRPGH